MRAILDDFRFAYRALAGGTAVARGRHGGLQCPGLAGDPHQPRFGLAS